MSEEKKEKPVKSCKIKGCKRPYRAKGYCTVHYHDWRRGELPKARYQSCQFGVKKLKMNEKKECLKKVFRSGLCEDHYKAALAKRRGQTAAPAPTPAAPATT